MHYVDLGRWRRTVGHNLYSYTNIDTGEDWYLSVAHNPERPLGFTFGLDELNRVVYIAHDPDQCDPHEKHMITMYEFEQTDEARYGILWHTFNFEDGTFTPPPRVTPDITPRQLRLWLMLRKQITSQMVVDKINLIPDETQRQLALIEWEYGVNFKHDNPLLVQIGALFNITPEEIIEGFFEAAEM